MPFRSSNEAFLEDIFQTYFFRIFNYCKKLMKGLAVEMAEEYAQNTFVQAQENIAVLNLNNFVGWLYVTARNHVNELYRKLYRKRLSRHASIACEKRSG